MIDGSWLPVRDGDPRGRALYLRHYSASTAARRLRDARGNHAQFIGPGEYIALLTVDCLALFVWRKEEFRLDDQQGINCSIFRNEGSVLSSDLILEAVAIAWERWPGERLFTFVAATKVRPKLHPGRCFLKAGWRLCHERSKTHGHLIFELEPLWMAAA